MNVGNILKVADAIEQASVPGLGFNMLTAYSTDGEYADVSGNSFGTVACIAGWARHIAGELLTVKQARLYWLDQIKPWADIYFGLDRDTGRDLMEPRQFIYLDKSPSSTEAVRCLRNLAITGKVDWDAAMKPDEPVLPPLPVRTSKPVTA